MNNGTTNYNDLNNKPKINDIELQGNLSLEDLGFTDNGTDNYEDLDNKPSINGNELTGNLTTEDLGISEFSGDYNDLSNIPDIPTELPNPEILKFGGVLPLKTYDGSSEVEVILPDFELLNEFSGTPVGEIIAFMGNTAPANYLICDGTSYNISDYPELADHFLNDFGKVNYFGGDGETTFAVPDLRGEFLRGSGANSHLNQFGTAEGSGSTPGTHQRATMHISLGYNRSEPSFWIDSSVFPDGLTTRSHINADSDIKGSSTTGRKAKLSNWSGAAGNVMHTSRPTNTSILYCIKCKPTFFVKMNTNETTNVDNATSSGIIDFTKEIVDMSGATIISKDGYLVNNMVTIFIYAKDFNSSVNNLVMIPEEYAPHHIYLGTAQPFSNPLKTQIMTRCQINVNGVVTLYHSSSFETDYQIQLTYPLIK